MNTTFHDKTTFPENIYHFFYSWFSGNTIWTSPAMHQLLLLRFWQKMQIYLWPAGIFISRKIKQKINFSVYFQCLFFNILRIAWIVPNLCLLVYLVLRYPEAKFCFVFSPALPRCKLQSLVLPAVLVLRYPEAKCHVCLVLYYPEDKFAALCLVLRYPDAKCHMCFSQYLLCFYRCASALV